MGSIPTRSRHLAWGLSAVLLALPGAAAAQDPPKPKPVAPTPAQPKPGQPKATQPTAGPNKPATPDTLNPLVKPLKPLPAFFMSLAVPGWAQARLDRKLTGAIFISLEGASLGMTMKTAREIGYLTRVGADTARITGKRRQRQDWLIFLGFNHLFAGIEGYVATQLHEFPADVGFRVVPAPGGGILATASVPFRIK